MISGEETRLAIQLTEHALSEESEKYNIVFYFCMEEKTFSLDAVVSSYTPNTCTIG